MSNNSDGDDLTKNCNDYIVNNGEILQTNVSDILNKEDANANIFKFLLNSVNKSRETYFELAKIGNETE